MTYAEKLKDPRWQKKRLEIFQRDDWTCAACRSVSKPLVAHHIVYFENPWDTHEEDIQTLCESCHDMLGIHPKGGVYWDYYNEVGSAVFHIAIVLCAVARTQGQKVGTTNVISVGIISSQTDTRNSHGKPSA